MARPALERRPWRTAGSRPAGPTCPGSGGHRRRPLGGRGAGRDPGAIRIICRGVVRAGAEAAATAAAGCCCPALRADPRRYRLARRPRRDRDFLRPQLGSPGRLAGRRPGGRPRGPASSWTRSAPGPPVAGHGGQPRESQLPVMLAARGQALVAWAIAAASVRLAAPSLPRMFETCTLAVFGAMNSSAAISLLLRPVASKRSTSRSRAVSPASGLASGPRSLNPARSPPPIRGQARRRGRDRARGSEPGPAGKIVERRAQRHRAEPVGVSKASRHSSCASSRRPASASASASRHRDWRSRTRTPGRTPPPPPARHPDRCGPGPGAIRPRRGPARPGRRRPARTLAAAGTPLPPGQSRSARGRH